jgi:hypothetical protein
VDIIDAYAELCPLGKVDLYTIDVYCLLRLREHCTHISYMGVLIPKVIGGYCVQ